MANLNLYSFVLVAVAAVVLAWPEFFAYFDSFWVRTLPFEIFSNFGHHLVNSFFHEDIFLLDLFLGVPLSRHVGTRPAPLVLVAQYLRAGGQPGHEGSGLSETLRR